MRAAPAQVTPPAINASAAPGLRPGSPTSDSGEATIGAAAGIFLQLGSFSAQSAAERFRARIKWQLDWLSEAVEVLFQDGWYRVRVGPYHDTKQARLIAARIERSASLAPVLQQR